MAGGGGGGRPDSAMAGYKDASKIAAALDHAAEIIASAVKSRRKSDERLSFLQDYRGGDPVEQGV